jgi:hypothetical protein
MYKVFRNTYHWQIVTTLKNNIFLCVGITQNGLCFFPHARDFIWGKLKLDNSRVCMLFELLKWTSTEANLNEDLRIDQKDTLYIVCFYYFF